ncbi:hypothetical protein HU200_003137 [Digitaria exilis]|uniref:Uncharacterized protein n=1 Tax=Digitaria exilis TaxID=1010633 RepID=A0A835FV19_9POAL|nr:hypothetical protein HU200_003137 [Digitaria exilis]
MGMDGGIPGTSGEFLRRVSSRAYGMRRHLMESLDSLAYDGARLRFGKLGQYTDHYELLILFIVFYSEVERELGMLFSKGGDRELGRNQKYPGSKFNMVVEDIREGVLIFEDEDDAVKYCDLLQGGGQGCEGIAEIEASSVFDICRKMKALAVLFRRGGIPPLPQSLGT